MLWNTCINLLNKKMMTITEIISVGLGFLGIGGSMIKWGNSMNQRITENSTEIVNIKRELEEHKLSNNTSFENVDKVYQEFISMGKTIVANSEKIANILRDMEEHKCNNDKSFERIVDLMKEFKTDNKEEHKDVLKLIGENQKQLTELVINKLN